MAKKKKKVIAKKGVTKKPSYKGKVRQFTLGSGLPSPNDIREELYGYREVLFGRQDPPLDKGVMTLMEVAEGYFSRACELEQLIYRAIAEGRLVGNAKKEYSALRTQEIRSFKEMSKSATELGSRRITWENIRVQQENRGLESI
jgi:hypothetical protein